MDKQNTTVNMVLIILLIFSILFYFLINVQITKEFRNC